MAGLTIKQEAFCQAYIETGNASEAYRTAYAADKMKAEAIHVKASELLSNGKVSVRLKELQGEIKQRHNVTVDSLLAELEEARQKALSAETPQSSAAVAATMGKAKLTGLDKQIVEMRGSLGLNLNKSLTELFEDDSD
ncbi:MULTISPECIES: terminase small subunit [Enterobacter cloacae complex]|uniref:terminase small subunit n=1 Tax=Enterobacter cloacae complex TaxID=354276 RepID=UPI0018C2FB14|nr:MULTISPECIES: terminase small subunit [Enterobacter cloacae complex]HBN6068330.1 terminase small subunit [Enterobacter cloacae]MBG0644819.1 terminase small subunit [Enterobacter kobei]MDS0065189.1 terminase small subunit [Enterobacter cloacae subsp. cloacae]MDS0107875.1 terminase small subunit [Enterobacter cloacae subsp. cloacae]MDW8497708.1 terminase small subunit [Enterobacter cloacae subsp. cloacae]